MALHNAGTIESITVN